MGLTNKSIERGMQDASLQGNIAAARQSQTRQKDEGKASLSGSVAPVDEVYAAAGRPTQHLRPVKTGHGIRMS